MHILQLLTKKFICKQTGCISEFQDAKALKKHLDRKHERTNGTSLPGTSNFSSRETNFASFTELPQTPILRPSNKANSLKDVKNKSKNFKDLKKNAAALYVSQLYSETAIPRSVVQNCISFTQEFFQCGSFNEIREIVFNFLEKRLLLKRIRWS